MRIFPHFRVRAWQKGHDVADYVAVPSSTMQQFFEPQATDAMAVAYDIEEASELPRLGINSAEAAGDVKMYYALLDIDNEDHRQWRSKAEASSFAAGLLSQLPPELATTAGLYTTRAGLRLMWELSPAVHYKEAKSLLVELGGRVERATGVAVDPASYEWSRMFRLPRAKRDGIVLDPPLAYAPLAPLDWGEAGFELVAEQHRPARDYGDLPDVVDEPSFKALAMSHGYDWIERGLPIPGDEGGHTYTTLRSTLAAIAKRGDVTDPSVLLALLQSSVEATPGRTVDEAWKLACWVCDRQANEIEDREVAEAQPPLVDRAASAEDWDMAEPYFRSRQDKGYLRHLRNGTWTSRTKPGLVVDDCAKALAAAYNDAAKVYSMLYPCFQGHTDAPEPAELWHVCRKAVDRHRKAIHLKATNGAFFRRYPLIVNVIGVAGSFYMLDTRSTPYRYVLTDKRGYLSTLKRSTAANLPDGVDLTELLDVPLDHLVADYGVNVTDVEMVSGAKAPKIEEHTDGGASLKMPAHQIMPISPRFHPEIDEWLTAFGGDHPDKLKDWLASVTQIYDSPLAALYVRAEPGCGKNLFTHGVASLWGSRPGDYNEIVEGASQSKLLKQPILHAEEGISAKNLSASMRFRQFVTQESTAIREKYRIPVTLHGAQRIIITANNDDALPFAEQLSIDDVQGIVDRIIYIRPRPEAKKLLEAASHRGTLKHWAPSEGRPGYLAEHILWLRDTRTVIPGRRLLVEGVETEWHRRFALRRNDTQNLLWVIQEFVDADEHVALGRSHGVAVLPEGVAVHPSSLRRFWSECPGNPGKPPANVSDKLNTLTGGRAKNVRIKGKQRRCYVVPHEVFQLSELGDPDETDTDLL